MKKIQPTTFKNIGDFLDSLSGEERTIVVNVRKLVLETLYPVEEKLAYNVPFYYRRSRICFIWPASVPWGGIKKGVVLGFCRGYLLSDDIGYLEKANRKEVTSRTFLSAEDIDSDLIKSYLIEAKEIDELSRNK